MIVIFVAGAFIVFACCSLWIFCIKWKAYHALKKIDKTPPERWLSNVYHFRYWKYVEEIALSGECKSHLYRLVIQSKIASFIGLLAGINFFVLGWLWLYG